MSKNMMLTRTRKVPKDGKWVEETEEFQVRVLAVAEGWAMVRRPRANPFCVSEKDLKPIRD